MSQETRTEEVAVVGPSSRFPYSGQSARLGRPAHQVAVRKCSCVVSYERTGAVCGSLDDREKILNDTCRAALICNDDRRIRGKKKENTENETGGSRRGSATGVRGIPV